MYVEMHCLVNNQCQIGIGWIVAIQDYRKRQHGLSLNLATSNR